MSFRIDGLDAKRMTVEVIYGPYELRTVNFWGRLYYVPGAVSFMSFLNRKFNAWLLKFNRYIYFSVASGIYRKSIICVGLFVGFIAEAICYPREDSSKVI